MEGAPYKLILPVLILWMMAILCVTDGGITWTEPPPSYTPASDAAADERAAFQRRILKGSTDVQLSWNYTLSDEDERGINLYFTLSGTSSRIQIGEKDSRGPFIFGQNNNRQRFNISSSEPATLIIYNVTEGEDGEYDCEVVTTSRKLYTDKIQVEVLDAPNITHISDNQTVSEDDVVTLNCTADDDGNPTPDITWKRVSDDSPVSFPLTISGKEDEGFYRCTANNSVATVDGRDVFITVENYHPFNTQVMTSLQNNITMVNETFNVTCSAEANPPAEYVFNKNDELAANITHPGVHETSVTQRVNQVRFSCVPFNVYGDGPRKEITIDVHYAPSILHISDNQTVSEDDVVTLNCTADGNPTPDITWKRVSDDSPVSFNFTITGKQDEGFYRCTANNSVGTVDGRDVFITVENYHPINTQVMTNLPNNTTLIDEMFNITCSADANPSPQYVIYKDDVIVANITTSPAVFPTSVADRISQVNFKCVPFNAFGDGDEKVVAVMVHYQPENVTLMTNLSGSTSCSGHMLHFTCTASANPPANLMLYENDTMLSESSPGVWIRRMREGRFDYKCSANNSVGNVSMSNNVALTVNVGSSIVEFSGNQNITEGNSVTLSCNVSGSPGPTVTWTNVNTGVNTTSNTLVIQNINRSQAGEYRCDATNDCGVDSRTAMVTVLYQPENVTLMTNASMSKTCSGTMVHFSCMVGEASPPSSFKLFKDNVMVNEAPASPGVWILMMANVGAAQYRCEASNSEGTVGSNNVTLTVNVKSSITPPLVNQEVDEGDNVTLDCDVSGTPLPSVSWTNLSSNVVMSNDQTYVITHITRAQAGDYKCDATNECGNATDTTTITVRCAPSVELVHDPMPWIIGGMKILTCQVSGRPMPHVFWQKKGGARRNATMWMFADITTDDAGEYVCTASNECGRVSKSVNVTARVCGCEQTCVDGKECRQFGGQYLCVCPVGKSGEWCNGVEAPSETVTTNLRITNETWKCEYCNLEHPVTKAFTGPFENTVLHTLRNTDVNKVTVTNLSPGSVIVEFEAAFNSTHGKREVDAVLKAQAQDGSLGSYKVDSIGSASGTTPPPSPMKCGSFWEGSNCDEVKPGWLALVIIAGVVLLAFIVAIIAFCMQKQKRRGGSIFTDDQNGRIGANGVSNGRAPVTGAGPHARDNIAYDRERYNGDGHERDTPMVTFGHAESRPEQTPGIMANDPSATKVNTYFSHFSVCLF